MNSVDQSGNPDDDEALVAELERRARAVADGTTELVDWPTVRDALRAKLKDGVAARRRDPRD